MNKSKNIVALTLMISSIALLLILQLFWLGSSYEKAFFDLRKDSNFIFRNTLYSLRDSLYQDNIKSISPDSLKQFDRGQVRSLDIIDGKKRDSVMLGLKSSTVQIFVNSDQKGNGDSVAGMIKPMTRFLQQRIQEGDRTFTIRLSQDTINIDTLKHSFIRALHKAGLPVDLTVRHQITAPERLHFRGRNEPLRENEATESIHSDTIQLESVRFNPMSRYSASIYPVQSFILKQIAPQILFSVFLTLITVIAFIVLHKNVRAQQRLMELKNDFISNVTHELKTPVSTVSVALEALKNFHALNDPKLTKEYLDIAQNELSRLTLMTDKILKASVFENKGITIQKESVDTKKITEQILDSMRLLFEKRQAQVSLQTKGENFFVEGEAAHITNVIYNLLDNALKYSPGKPVIDITLTPTSDYLVLSVRDQGLGIPAEYKKKIFEKFFRVPTGDVHDIKGYGLGLSYVAGVVKAHHGSIEVESEFGKGSNFIIHWPKHHA